MCFLKSFTPLVPWSKHFFGTSPFSSLIAWHIHLWRGEPFLRERAGLTTTTRGRSCGLVRAVSSVAGSSAALRLYENVCCLQPRAFPYILGLTQVSCLYSAHYQDVLLDWQECLQVLGLQEEVSSTSEIRMIVICLSLFFFHEKSLLQTAYKLTPINTFF